MNRVDHEDHIVETTEAVADGAGSNLSICQLYCFSDGDGSTFDRVHGAGTVD